MVVNREHGGGVVTGISKVGARDAAQGPRIHRTASHPSSPKKYPVQNIKNAQD